jgi:hypothetical protein
MANAGLTGCGLHPAVRALWEAGAQEFGSQADCRKVRLCLPNDRAPVKHECTPEQAKCHYQGLAPSRWILPMQRSRVACSASATRRWAPTTWGS